MNDKMIETFEAVVSEGSFAKAAEKLYCSNVTVMNQINTLESETGVTLFNRTNHGADLTAAGRIFYEDMRRVTEMISKSVSRARQTAASGRKIIRVGTSILRPCREITDIWKDIEQYHPEFQIMIVPFSDEPASLSSVLDDNSGIDCIVGPCDSSEWQTKYNIEVISQLSCMIGVPQRHRLAHRKKLSWADLKGESIIMMKQGVSSAFGRLRSDISNNHHDIRIIDTSSIYTLDTFNVCDQLNCLMETLDIWSGVHPSIKTIPVEWNHYSPYGIIFKKKPSPSLREFIDITIDELTEPTR
ncbi:MAG: LysR family transcriptional regulator [Anaerovoracaceae bacterium]|nr:LysR family transcriptional regulator [Bacillota bacterium]MDY2671264.1 LysR family transcriptional regulator [Anaerovoracaceae bacterium]